jgi:uncharacterized protein (TIRG00374 family)
MTMAPTNPSAAVHTARDRWLMLGLLVLVVGGLAGLAAGTGWAETWAQLSKLTVGAVLALLALSLVNYGLRALRWHVYAGRLGLPTSLARNVTHFVGGFAMSVTPGRVGELVRMRWLRRETGWSFERTAPLVLADRAADLAAMAILMAAGVSLSSGGMTGALPVAAAALVAAVVVTRPALLQGLADIGYRLTRRGPRLFARVRTASRSLGRFSSPGIMAVAAGLGLVGWAAEGWAFHLLLTWFGTDLGVARAIAIFTFATLAGGLTGAPGGVGGAEAAMVALLTLDGVPLEVSVPATAVIRLTTLWFALVLGLIVFPFAERAPT